MDQDFSQLIRSLRLIMVMGLVFVHFGNFPGDNLDPFMGVVDADFIIASSLNSFFTYFFLCSVPVLSLISGYLYCYQGSPNFLDSIKKKSKTLILPYLSWTSFWLVFAFILYSIGKSSNQFTYYDQGFSDYSYLDLFNGIIGITEAPFAFQFWFVHDLVLSILISPLIILLIKRIGIITVAIPFILWATEVDSLVFFNFKVVAFFNLGLYAGIKRYQPSIPNDLSNLNLSIPIFIAMVIARIYVPAYFDGLMPYDTIFELILRIVGSVAIITLALNLRLYFNNIYLYLSNHSGYAFFLHAFHFPLVILVKQLLYKTGLFIGEAGLVSLWLISVILTILIGILSAEFLNRFMPPIYRFLNGQRSI